VEYGCPNEEGYSKLKATVKESVRADLAENKKQISISFVTLILTIKADPQMVKLIQNMPSAYDGGQYKDNNNIKKYLEFNKDNLSDLVEKHYENFVEALTNNVINDSAASPSSSNTTLSLPQSSSSTFPNLSAQSDTCRIEEPTTE
jgi:hypothetical protein